jgi:type II secretory pathway pseudopilin PulG
MAIITILAALVLAAGSGVMAKAARSRATTEIQAMGNSLEAYKNDNGTYPVTYPSTYPVTTPMLTNAYTSSDGSLLGGAYQESAQFLYLSLSGKTNFLDQPAAGVRSYFSFKVNQVGAATAPVGTAAGNVAATYVKDPWNYAYGYSTGSLPGAATPSYPYSGTGFYDLWSTGGILQSGATATWTNTWIYNWQL